MPKVPLPSFPRKREPGVFDVAFRGSCNESHWVPAFAGMTVDVTAGRLLGLLLLLSPAPALAQQAIGEPRLLDGFEDAKSWRVVTSNQVSGSLRMVDGAQGRALCLDYDFNGVSGYAGIQRDLPVDYPDNYAFAFELRGESPANDLEMKFIDASGDNVWWV